MPTKTILQTVVGELDAIKDSSLKRSTSLISASPKISIKDALTLMTKYDILCLPIQSHQDPHRVVNLVNLFDILTYLVNQVSKGFETSPPTSNPSRRKSLDSSTMLNPGVYCKLKEPIENVMSLDPDRESYRLFTCLLTDNLEKVIACFGRGIHRAVVFDQDGAPKHILTQMDIIRHLKAHTELLPAAIDCQKTIVELELFSKKSITLVEENTLATSAFKIMAENRYTSVVIVDSTSGKAISNLSASSLRGLTSNNIDQITLPVKDFMRVSPRGPRPLVICLPTYKFWDLVDALVDNNSHHAWLVDQNHRPYASISPTDILHLISSCR